MTHAKAIALTFSTLLVSFCIHAETNLTKPLHESQSLIIENSDFSVASFQAAALSTNITERRYAEMYLLGVMDASEGRDWCDYKTIQTITVDEAVFTGLKEYIKDRKNMRAATAIKEVLSQKFSCRMQK